MSAHLLYVREKNKELRCIIAHDIQIPGSKSRYTDASQMKFFINLPTVARKSHSHYLRTCHPLKINRPEHQPSHPSRRPQSQCPETPNTTLVAYVVMDMVRLKMPAPLVWFRYVRLVEPSTLAFAVIGQCGSP